MSSNLSTYTTHDLIVMAESNGSHPECSQVPTAAIVKECERRILVLEETVRVLAEYAGSADGLSGPFKCWDSRRLIDARDGVFKNPIARAAVEKAREGA